MKKRRELALLLATVMAVLSATASSSSESVAADHSSDTAEDTRSNISGGDRSSMNEDTIAGEPGTRITLVMNDVEVAATLNNTVTARAFARLLPYSVTVSRAADDLCGSVRETLPSDSSEGQSRWRIGEIGWFGGWFTILVDNEERFSNMPGVMIIGKIDEGDIPTVQKFTGRVNITVRLADERTQGGRT